MEEVAEKKQNDLNKKKSFLDTFLGETTETDEIIIPYSSQYQAYDALTKILKSLFPKSIQGTFCTALKTAFNKERRLGLPKYVLYPSNQPKFFSVDEHKFIDIYGPGLYAYSALNEKSIFRSLAVLGNGPERVSPYVHVLKIKNSEEVFKAYNAQNCALTKHSDQAHRPTSLTPPSASHLTFSTDLYTFVFRPHIPPFKLSEHYFFGTDNQKVNQLVKKVLEFTKKVEEKNSEIRNGLFALSEKLFWDEELDDSEILLIKKVVHEEGYHMGFLATTTAECVKRYLDELVACRAGLKRAKEELDELLTGLLELDLGKEHHVEVMKLLLVNRFGPYEFAAEEKEIEMEAVARIKFLPTAEASHLVATYGVTGADEEQMLDVEE